MVLFIIICIVVALGAYFCIKNKKVVKGNGGSGGTDDPKPTDPNYPNYSN